MKKIFLFLGLALSPMAFADADEPVCQSGAVAADLLGTYTPDPAHHAGDEDLWDLLIVEANSVTVQVKDPESGREVSMSLPAWTCVERGHEFLVVSLSEEGDESVSYESQLLEHNESGFVFQGEAFKGFSDSDIERLKTDTSGHLYNKRL